MDKTTYKREACQMLMGSEGWRVLLEYCIAQLTQLDLAIYEVTTPEAVRQQHLGHHKAITSLVNWVCAMAGEPNPFEVHRQALWSTLEVRDFAREKWQDVQNSLHGDAEMSIRRLTPERELAQYAQAEKQKLMEEIQQRRQHGGGSIA